MDGFTGNVVLKACETLAEFVIELIREEVVRDARGKLGGWLLKPAFRAVKRRSDPGEIGGAPLLGMRGCCVIGHGKSHARAVMHGIRTAAEFHRSGVNARDRGRPRRPRRARAGGQRMSLAFVFPGQGSQEAGMGRALADAFPESRAVFDEADDALGFALSRLCFEGPEPSCS